MIKPKIFILYEFFPPAYKSGGITRSLGNLSRFLSKENEVYVFTGNKDMGEDDPLQVQFDNWEEIEPQLFVYYASREHQKRNHIFKILEAIRPDIIYINGLFTPNVSFIPLLIRKKLSFQANWVIAPRGQLNEGALAVKFLKKRLYLTVMKSLRLFKDLTWHATEEEERQVIHRFGIPLIDIKVASNIPEIGHPPVINLYKEKNELRLVFLALISPIKNLDGLLRALDQVSNSFKIGLDIIGPIKDLAYWNICQSLIAKLPAHIDVRYLGEVRPEESHKHYIKYHCFAMLSKGENFGHSIFEALHAGTPVLISDKTPWRKLDSVQAGWDLDLSSPELIAAKIQKIAAMSAEEYMPWREGARQLADDFIQKTDFTAQYQRLFSLHDKNENDKTFEIQ